MEIYLKLFEQAIQKQIEFVGKEKAYEQAKKAGLGVSDSGNIVSCTGNPQLVLIKLIKFFTEGGNLTALMALTPLIDELLKQNQIEEETSSLIS
ncbi:MAG: hypothetical protein U9N54_11260 [candidate division Zixibacteria bacterium]|nr:hypothetical protein [candidate division Zixibacteria bacterium]